jgi:hypothetical protein
MGTVCGTELITPGLTGKEREYEKDEDEGTHEQSD